ncbi:cytochrome-c oxidase, cbb3-type subunit III [Marinospirillum perlucidum]|uniref:cytochrome-c oxidase, cbb3-type subunit III n=1 Tax=Marinospirillum perlucidum TaxID=1982602 RepID=UPI000DF444B7|nr:cytochrome-c oxidase, cbb3-type subunit III [Marinospirillum perlucidum]
MNSSPLAMSGFWSLWISVITLGVIAFCWWLLYGNRKTDKAPSASGEVETTGHAADGIEEYDNPLPRWWFIMFVITIVFGLVYLVLYPGLGSYKGVLGWTAHSQWEEEVAEAREEYAPIFQNYAQISVEELAQDPEAMQVADRLYQNNCAICHGSSARGGYGFPNLTDDNWMYGGEPAQIRQTIIWGRNGNMVAYQNILGEEGIENMANYVLSLSGQEHDADKAAEAAPQFQAQCVACHGPNAKGAAAQGLPDIGAPDLTDDYWLYQQPGQELKASIVQTLTHGRNGHMPAQAGYLDVGVDLPSDLRSKSQDELAELLPKVHLVTAYIYSLSNQ